MLFEMLVVMAFLAVATGIAINLHQARLDYDRSSTERLRQQLAIENLAEQLASIPYADILESAPELAIQWGAHVNIDRFQNDSAKGLHVIVSIESVSGPLSHHVWRLESKP